MPNKKEKFFKNNEENEKFKKRRSKDEKENDFIEDLFDSYHKQEDNLIIKGAFNLAPGNFEYKEGGSKEMGKDITKDKKLTPSNTSYSYQNIEEKSDIHLKKDDRHKIESLSASSGVTSKNHKRKKHYPHHSKSSDLRKRGEEKNDKEMMNEIGIDEETLNKLAKQIKKWIESKTK